MRSPAYVAYRTGIITKGLLANVLLNLLYPSHGNLFSLERFDSILFNLVARKRVMKVPVCASCIKGLFEVFRVQYLKV